MDNLKRFKRHKVSERPTSIDGLLRPSARSRNLEANPFARHRTYQAARPRLDDFKRTQGFHPNRLASLNVSSGNSFGRQPVRDSDGRIDIGKPQHRGSRRKTGSPFAGRHMAMKAISLILIVGLVSVGYTFGKTLLNAQQTFSGGATTAIEEVIQKDGRINVLLLGRGGEEHTAPDLIDTIMLASIDPINNEAALVSIPRDLYTKPDGFDGYTKINAVYVSAKNEAIVEGSSSELAQQAGLQAIQSAVVQFTGVPVHYYVMVDFEGFKKAIDIVGGIDVNVPEDLAASEIMYIDGRNYRLNVPAGTQHLDSFRALAFARSRLTSVNGDFTRSERQRLILTALRDKALTMGTFANPIQATQLINTLGEHVRTNLSGLGELARLYEIGQAISTDRVESIGLADSLNSLVETDNIGGLSVVVPAAGLGRYDEIHQYLGQKLRNGFLKRENAQILVLNGTSIDGLATRIASDLKSDGYSVAGTGDAVIRQHADTIIVELSNRDVRKTRGHLEKHFNRTVTSELPEGIIAQEGIDFVIVVGSD